VIRCPAIARLPAAARLLPPLLLLAGCVATPADRIAKNPELFAALPVADQDRIRLGQIELGFTPDMVRLALGDPDRHMVRRAVDGTAEIWFYVETVNRYERQRVDIDGLSVRTPGGVRTTGGDAWITILEEKEFVRLRVEFRDGKVAVIEGPFPAESK